METKQITKNELYTVEFNESEWNLFNQCVCFTEYKINIRENEPTVVNRDTLWMFLCELHKAEETNEELEKMKKQLETLLYPEKNED